MSSSYKAVCVLVIYTYRMLVVCPPPTSHYVGFTLLSKLFIGPANEE